MSVMYDTSRQARALPARPWSVFMRWLDLAFLHWPVPADQLRRQLPRGFELDTFDGDAWIGVVPFRMTGIRHRLFAPVPGLSAFHELNVRTYVTHKGKPGVWFFSLDAASAFAVRVARRTFHLRYYHARMMSRASTDGTIAYESVRTHRGEPPAKFVASYRPVGNVFHATPGTLEHFLAERYCLYAVEPSGRVLRGDVDHEPWPLRRGEVETRVNTMIDALGLELLRGEPLVHVTRGVDAVAWRLAPA